MNSKNLAPMNLVHIKLVCVLLGLFFVQLASAALPIQKIPLSSGAQLYFVETRGIPMVNIGIDFPGGSVHDAKGKIGVSDFTADLMNKGSRIKGSLQDEAKIVDRISDLGAAVSFQSGSELTTVRIKTLSKTEVLNQVVEQVSDMLAFPLFDGKILAREKTLEMSALKDSETKPETILAKQFKKMIYRDHPLANMSTTESILKISREDLRQFHQKFYRPGNMKILIVGDVSQEKAIAIANRLVANLPKGTINLPELPKLEPLAMASSSQREIRIANPAQQAHIQLGITAIPRNSPDYFPLLVGNYVLGGGGFVSRLMNEVREKRGLAYSVYSYLNPGKNSGFFSAAMQTKKDQAEESVQLLRKTIQEYVENGPTPEELVAAKSNLINGFPLRIDSNSKLLDNISSIAWHDLPLNTLDEWTNQVNQVTQRDIQIALKKYLDMDRMVTVVVGGQ